MALYSLTVLMCR